MNPTITIQKEETLADNWYTLKTYTFYYQSRDGTQEQQKREVYHNANGATVLLYNTQKRTVILTRQFRIASFVNENPTGMLIETCAGIMDEKDPEAAVIRETEEETGIKLKSARKVFELYMSPGAVSEKLHFFVAEYTDAMKTAEGGGEAEEQEHIEVLEVSFEEALQMVARGEIKDAKTVLLLQYAQLNKLLG
ncbi:NUDIX domain-containing protein [Telluribacter sp.]|jgi:nudix-type nucleoside diphosphatase (YffH/AdpP family)|uniref:NUDIX domain-containing protein n=1 Tax=Telluribacter sp. TaxID=1978767 RepID=UPI002E11EC65|nr:NUDIX domain-containing protein [Telluribacter sp.]